MDFFKALCLVAIKAAALEAEARPGGEFVALRAFDASDGWMLLESREFSRGVGSREEANFLATAFPLENEGVRPGGDLHLAVEHVWEGLRDFERLAIEFQLAGWSGGDDIDSAALVRRLVGWPHNLSRFVIGEEQDAENEQGGWPMNFHLRMRT